MFDLILLVMGIIVIAWLMKKGLGGESPKEIEAFRVKTMKSDQ